MQIGYITIANNNSKNKGIKRAFPKYRMTAEKSITCRYFRTDGIGCVLIFISFYLCKKIKENGLDYDRLKQVG